MTLRLNMLAGFAVIGLPIAASAQSDAQSKAEAATHATNDPKSKTEAATEVKTEPTAEAATEAKTEPVAEAKAGAVKAAAKSDVKVGASVFGSNGEVVGKIESVSDDGAVVSTGDVRAQIPLSSLGLGEKGLVVAMTRADFEAAAKAKKPK